MTSFIGALISMGIYANNQTKATISNFAWLSAGLVDRARIMLPMHPTP